MPELTEKQSARPLKQELSDSPGLIICFSVVSNQARAPSQVLR
jgi:hypothetical protein